MIRVIHLTAIAVLAVASLFAAGSVASVQTSGDHLDYDSRIGAMPAPRVTHHAG